MHTVSASALSALVALKLRGSLRIDYIGLQIEFASQHDELR
jgi:hypothetical protein